MNSPARIALLLLLHLFGLAACGSASVSLPGGVVADDPDNCPNDPLKRDPGLCGCGAPDNDADGDGMLDCIESCPEDPEKNDPGRCGCGVPDDVDGDGIVDCDSGCADGQREGFRDRDFVNIAACGGGFEIPGVITDASRRPQCERLAGDDSENPDGDGCSVADLCAEGWHVCETATDASQSLPEGTLCNPVPEEAALAFFVSRASGSGGFQCQGDGADDIFGCGNMGDIQLPCTPLERTSNNRCKGLDAPWHCGGIESEQSEALVVTKPGAGGGGALCCRD